MKVFLHYEDCLEDELRMTIKLTLPKKWRSGPAQRLVDVFVESYNKKHGDGALQESEVHFEKKDGLVVPFDAPVNSFMESGEDLYLKNGPGQTMDALKYKPLFEVDGGEDKKEGVKKPVSSMAAAIAAADAKLKEAQEKEEGNKAQDEKKQVAKDTLLCKRFGCNKRYHESENHDEACVHHSKPPVFHETRKFWACCPDKIGYDWESFQSIPGCCVSRHTNEKQGGQQFLGGSDVRKEQEETHNQGIPQRLDTKGASGMDKLSSLRKALIGIGVPGQSFDQARDKLKSSFEHEDATKLWDHVCEQMGVKMKDLLENI